MNIGLISLIAVAGVLLVLFMALAHKRLPKKLKTDKFIADWKELQSFCRDKSTWPDAVLEADRLFDKALKKRRYKGKRMGERMVAAQRDLSSNDQLWFAHNLAKKVAAEPEFKLKETEVKTALVGFRQALRDIGALDQPQVTEQEQTEKKS